MGIRFMERMARLVRADAHGVLDQLEERSLLLKQHLREAEIELHHKRAELESLDEELRRLEEEGGRLQERIAALDEDVALALAGDKEELARFAIRRLIPQREAHAPGGGAPRGAARGAGSDWPSASSGSRASSRSCAGGCRPSWPRPARAPRSPPSLAPEGGVADEEVELELLRRRGDLAEGVS